MTSKRRLNDLKQLDAKRGQKLSSLVDEFLSEGLFRSRTPKLRVAPLPVFNMGAPRVDVADRDNVFDAMEQE